MSDKSFFDDLISEYNCLFQDGTEAYLQNYQALEYLQKKQAKWLDLFSANNLPPTTPTAVDGLVSAMTTLLDEFKDEGIKLTPRVKTDQGIIDLLVKTLDRRSVGLMLRSNGASRVKWREDRGEFFVSRKKGTSKWSELDSIAYQLDSMMKCLREKENPLLGSSRTERKKGITKTIVLAGQTRLDPNNDPTRLVNFGRATVLKMNHTSAYYVVDLENLANFLHKPIEK
jgi:hypothetical protein